MQCSGTIDVTVEFVDRLFVVHEVPYSVSYDYTPASRYASNGDPGEPGSEDFQFSCELTEDEAIEAIIEVFLADSEAIPPWVVEKSSIILHAIQKEAYDRVYDRVAGSAL